MSAPIYTTVASVKVRLAGKVQFQRDPSAPRDGELPDDLLEQLIADAEAEVEQDLRSRYAVPFQSIRTGRYSDLPDHTQRALRTAVDQKAVMNVLMTDFGRGTHVSAEGYMESLKEHYEAYVTKLMGRDAEAKSDKVDRYRFSPPLDDLKLFKGNALGDDGYRGTIINTDGSSRGAETYAPGQVNDPSRGIFGRRGW